MTSWPPEHVVAALDPAAQLGHADHAPSSLSDLLAQGAALAAHLEEQHAPQPGSLVPVLEADPLRLMVALLALWHLDCVPVPLDPQSGRATLGTVHDKLAPALWLHGVPPAPARLPRAQPQRRGTDCAMVLFTSGSTGSAKAVPFSHANLRASITAISSYLPIRRFPHTAITLPLHYAYALVGQVLVTLACGGRLSFFGDTAFAAPLLAALQRNRVQGLSTVPSQWQRLCEAAEDDGTCLGHLGYAASAGARLPTALHPTWQQLCPNATLFNQYGCSEAGPRISAIANHDRRFAQGAVGFPVAGLELAVLGPNGLPVACGVEGNVAVTGPMVMAGYLGERREAPHWQGRYFLTGDRGLLDSDGCLFLEGRTDRLVNIGGERVSLDAVEETLRQHGTVRDVAVVAQPHAHLGCELAAYIVGDADELAALRQYMAHACSPARRPSRWVYVPTLPYGPRGKLRGGIEEASRA